MTKNKYGESSAMIDWQKKKDELEEFKKNGQIDYKTYQKEKRVLEATRPGSVSYIFGIVVMVIIVLSVAVTWVSMGAQGSRNEELATQVKTELMKLDDTARTMLASTGVGGYQGDVVDVKPGSGSNGVLVEVSTYFTNPGNEADGGQMIARNLFNIICSDVPELNSLYVTSTSSGLDSLSVYRSGTACR